MSFESFVITDLHSTSQIDINKYKFFLFSSRLKEILLSSSIPEKEVNNIVYIALNINSELSFSSFSKVEWKITYFEEKNDKRILIEYYTTYLNGMVEAKKFLERSEEKDKITTTVYWTDKGFRSNTITEYPDGKITQSY